MKSLQLVNSVFLLLLFAVSNVSSQEISGELRKWHKVTLTFTGPQASETDLDNPFLNYRFDVTFLHERTGRKFKVPGYFAANGIAANTSATAGNKWNCHFAPDDVGIWNYTASFVYGTNVSVSQTDGSPRAFHGTTGSINIRGTDKLGRDHRKKGRLRYVGRNYLQYSDVGEWFLKVGSDRYDSYRFFPLKSLLLTLFVLFSPENLLAYKDFDNTPNNKGFRKTWNFHKAHFINGTDPTWKDGRGAGLIGAINYLSGQGMNAFSFLTMNIGGDDQNVFPYISETERLRMDVSKLAQWEIIFEHADKMGMFMHFKTFEQENDQLLDGGELGNERKLYYRELVARFGHHLALCWNLGEEISNTVEQIKDFSNYVRMIDPYGHLIVVHTRPNSELYSDLIGLSTFDAPSLQTHPSNVFDNTLYWVKASAAAGREWVVFNDEQNPAKVGVVPDSVDRNHDEIRRDVLWGNLMAGGGGVEYYFGYDYANSDLTCQNFRSRESMWRQSRHAWTFFKLFGIPFWQMSNDAFRVTSSTDWLLSSWDGLTHVIYRKNTILMGSIDLVGLDGNYSVRWFNPREGGRLQNGTKVTVTGGGIASLGLSPNSSDTMDWAILLRKI